MPIHLPHSMISTVKPRSKILKRTAILHITTKCNFNCIHCYLTKEKNMPERLLSNYKILIENLKKLGVEAIVLTGGELFIKENSELFELISYAQKKGFSVNINSNASLITSSIADKLKKLKINSIDIGLNAVSKNTFKLFTGTDYLDKVFEGIGNLLKKQINIKFSVVPTKINYNDMINILNEFKDNKLCSFSFIFLRPVGRALTNFEKLGLSAEELKKLSLKLLAYSKLYKLNTNIEFPFNVSLDYNKEEIKGCPGGEERITVWPDGSISPCVFLSSSEFIVGNILENHNPDQNLFKKAKKAIEKKITGKCIFCKFASYCTGGCPASSYHLLGNKNKPDPFCKF